MSSLSWGTPQHWEHRAQEARAIADGVRDPETKRILLSIADGYDRMAKLAEAREAHVPMPDRKRADAGGSA